MEKNESNSLVLMLSPDEALSEISEEDVKSH